MAYNTKNYTEQGGDVTHFGGKVIFEEDCEIEGLPESEVPDATTTTKGLVLQATSVPIVTGETVTPEVFNSLLHALQNAGIMAVGR